MTSNIQATKTQNAKTGITEPLFVFVKHKVILKIKDKMPIN